MKIKQLLSIFVIGFFGFYGMTQEEELGRIKVFLGFNAVDNSNSTTQGPWGVENLDVRSPLVLGLEYQFKPKWGLGLNASFNKLESYGVKSSFFSLDAGVNYYWLSSFKSKKKWDLYTRGGLTYYNVFDDSGSAFNLGLGFNYWFTRQLGVQLSGTGNLHLGDEVAGLVNYYQYNVGVIWRPKRRKDPAQQNLVESQNATEIDDTLDARSLDGKSTKSNKGVGSEQKNKQGIQPKTSQTDQDAEGLTKEATNKEDQYTTETQIRDSVSPVKTVIDEQGQRNLVDMDVVPEKQLPKLVVYFNKNSSYFDKTYEGLLRNLSKQINKIPYNTIRIKCYNDATGTKAYNQWLLDRRMKRIINYLKVCKVDLSKLVATPIGIDAKAPCYSSTEGCSESQYKLQRRCELYAEE